MLSLRCRQAPRSTIAEKGDGFNEPTEPRHVGETTALSRLHDDPAAGTSQTGLRATESSDTTVGAGIMIGRYHLLQRIGEAGMGEVLARRQKELAHRRGALKLRQTLEERAK